MDVSNSSRCLSCWARKWNCDGARPVCTRCQQEHAKCSYDWSLDNGIFDLFPPWANLNGQIALERGAQQDANGGFARVYRTRTHTGHLVAVKVFFDHKRPPTRALELSVREAFTWHRLDHPNIVPFLGIADYAKICPGGFSQLCLVSPWMADGNIMEYLKKNPTVSPLPLLLDIVNAVLYLHSFLSTPIIHGDLKGNNILIGFDASNHANARPYALLIDFGLSQIMEVGMEDDVGTTSTAENGNARWLAFERILPAKYGLRQSECKSTMSDIFEMMRTFFEILTGGPPFQGMSDYAALAEVLQGSNPERPARCHWLDDDLWNLMLKCWSNERQARPSLDLLKQDLEWSISLDHVLGLGPYVDFGLLLRTGIPERKLATRRQHVTAIAFELSNMHNLWTPHLESMLSNLHLKVLRFHAITRWTGQEQVDAILRLTPFMRRLELCANKGSPPINFASILQAAEMHTSNLTTLIMRYVPTATFGLLSWSSLLNLEIRAHDGEDIPSAHRFLAVVELLSKTPSLERLVLHDLGEADGTISWNTSPGMDQIVGESDLRFLGERKPPFSGFGEREPPLSRLQVFHLCTSDSTMASAYLMLPSRSNLRELSISIGSTLAYLRQFENIEQLVAWPQLKVLSLPPPSDSKGIQVYYGLTALEDLELPRTDLYLLELASNGRTILPSLKTLRIRRGGDIHYDSESIVKSLRARESAGVPLQRLLIREDYLEEVLYDEPELKRVKVQIGRYRPRDGFEGVEAALEPGDVLLSNSELRQYGLHREPKPKGPRQPGRI